MERIIEGTKLYHRTCIRERQRSLRTSPGKSGKSGQSLHSPGYGSKESLSGTRFPFSSHQDVSDTSSNSKAGKISSHTPGGHGTSQSSLGSRFTTSHHQGNSDTSSNSNATKISTHAPGGHGTKIPAQPSGGHGTSQSSSGSRFAPSNHNNSASSSAPIATKAPNPAPTESMLRHGKQTEKRKVQNSPFIAQDSTQGNGINNSNSSNDMMEAPHKKPFLANLKKTPIVRPPWEQEAQSKASQEKVSTNGGMYNGIEDSQKDYSSVFHRPFMPKAPVEDVTPAPKKTEIASKNRQAMMGFMKSNGAGETDKKEDGAKLAWKGQATTTLTTTTTATTTTPSSSSRYTTPTTSSSLLSSSRFTTTTASLSPSLSSSRYTKPTTATTASVTTTSSSSLLSSTTTTAPKRPLFASRQKAKPLTTSTTTVPKDSKPEVEIVGTFTTVTDPKPPVANFQGPSSETKTFHGLLDRLANIRAKISEASADPILASVSDKDAKKTEPSPPSPPPPLPSSTPPPKATTQAPKTVAPKSSTFKQDFGPESELENVTRNQNKTDKMTSQDHGLPRPILKHHDENHRDTKGALKSQDAGARRKSQDDLLKPILKGHEDSKTQDSKPRRKSHDDLLKPILKSHEDRSVSPKPILKTHEHEPKPILKPHEDTPSWLSHKSILKDKESHDDHPPRPILKSASDANNRSRSTSPKPILKSTDLSVGPEKNRSRNASPKSILKSADENTGEENGRRSSLDSILKPAPPKKLSISPVMAHKSILKSKPSQQQYYQESDMENGALVVGNRFSAFTVKDSVAITHDSKENAKEGVKGNDSKPVGTKPSWQKNSVEVEPPANDYKPVAQGTKPSWQKHAPAPTIAPAPTPAAPNARAPESKPRAPIPGPDREVKTEWQIEAEKRAAMRGGKYVDPEFRSRAPAKKSPGTQRRHPSPAPDLKLSTVGQEPEKYQGFNLDKTRRSRSKSPRRLAFGDRAPDLRKEIHVDIPKIPTGSKLSESKVDSPSSSLSNGSPRSVVSTDSPRSARSYGSPRSGGSYDSPRSGRSYDSPRSGRSYDSPRSGRSYDSPRSTTSTDSHRSTHSNDSLGKMTNGSALTDTKISTKKTENNALTDTKMTVNDSPKQKPEAKKPSIPFSSIFRSKNQTSPPSNQNQTDTNPKSDATKKQPWKSQPKNSSSTEPNPPATTKTSVPKIPGTKSQSNKHASFKPKANDKTHNDDLDELNQLLLNPNTDPFGRTDLDTNGRKISRSPAFKISPTPSPQASPPLVHTRVDNKPVAKTEQQPKPNRPQDLPSRKKPELPSSSSESKTEWQLEVERRQKARKGMYVDPEKKHLSPASSPPTSPPTSPPPSGLWSGPQRPSQPPSRSQPPPSRVPSHPQSQPQAPSRPGSLAPAQSKPSAPSSQGPLRRIVPEKPISFDWQRSEEESGEEVSSPETPVAPPRRSKNKPAWMQTRPLPSPPKAEDWTPKRQIQAEKRLSASAILEQLAGIDQHLQQMEAAGRSLELRIRAESDDAMDNDDDELMVEWFELVNKKNDLVRWESELMYKQRQQEYEDRHAEVEYELRLLMAKPERMWTSSDKVREQSLLQELQDIVNLRNNIVDSMEEDRIRYLEEDQEIEEKMTARAFKETPSPKKKGKKKKNKKEKKEEKKKKAKSPTPKSPSPKSPTPKTPQSPLEIDEYHADANTMDKKPFCFKMTKGSSGC